MRPLNKLLSHYSMFALPVLVPILERVVVLEEVVSSSSSAACWDDFVNVAKQMFSQATTTLRPPPPEGVERVDLVDHYAREAVNMEDTVPGISRSVYLAYKLGLYEELIGQQPTNITLVNDDQKFACYDTVCNPTSNTTVGLPFVEYDPVLASPFVSRKRLRVSPPKS